MASSARRTLSVAILVAALLGLVGAGVGYHLYRQTRGVQSCTMGQRHAQCRRVFVAENPAQPDGKQTATSCSSINAARRR